MAKKAATVGQWMKNRRRFANVFNAKIFDGVQVIKPEELEPIEGETHILLQTKDGKKQEIHRYRDITMRWKGKMDLMIRTNDDLRKYIPNYTINLIDAERIENLEVYQNDLQMIFGLLKCRRDKQKLRQYVEDNQEFFKSVDEDTRLAISSFMNSNRIMSEMKNQNEGGQVDMCKALEDWAAEERAEGRLEGREENLVNQIRKKLAKGKDIATIADEIEETEDVVKQLMEKHNLKA